MSSAEVRARWTERRRSRDDVLLRLGLPAFLGIANLSVGLLAREVTHQGAVGFHGVASLLAGCSLLLLVAIRAVVEHGWLHGPVAASSRRAYRRAHESIILVNAVLLGVDGGWALYLMQGSKTPALVRGLSAILAAGVGAWLGRVASRSAGWRGEGPRGREIEPVFLAPPEAMDLAAAVDADVLCQYCSCPILPVDAVSCRRCETLHHQDCWAEGLGCTTYGCHETRCFDLGAAS